MRKWIWYIKFFYTEYKIRKNLKRLGMGEKEVELFIKNRREYNNV